MKRDINIAYIMLCHDDPEIVARIVKALKYNQDKVFIHVDKKSDIVPFEKLMISNDNAIFVKSRVENYWGGYSSIVATMETIREALKSGQFERFIILQGKDYPLYSSQKIHNFFINHMDEEFCKAKDITISSDRKDYMKCYGFWWQDVRKTLISRFVRHYLKVLNVKIGKKYRKGYFKSGHMKWHIYKGWAQVALTKECVTYILNVYDNNRSFNNYMKHCFPPDELYIHTIIHNSEFGKKLSEYSLQFRENAEWRDEYLNLTYFEYPFQITVYKSRNDYEWLLTTGALFVRKVSSTESRELLDYIDKNRSYEN